MEKRGEQLQPTHGDELEQVNEFVVLCRRFIKYREGDAEIIKREIVSLKVSMCLL